MPDMTPIPFPEKKYRIILADCPWSYQNWSDKKHGAASAWYQCMTVRQIASLPVGQVADTNCALFLWITGPKLVEGSHLPILWAWGFKPVSLLVWRKTYADGKPYCGLGFYTRSRYEFLVLATKGKMPRRSEATNVSQELEAAVRLHSQKPEKIYDVIQELYGDLPRLELFARGPAHPGWDIWGAEAGVPIQETREQEEDPPCSATSTTE